STNCRASEPRLLVLAARSAQLRSIAIHNQRVRGHVGVLDSRVDLMDCRPGCAACCIAPSISSPIPGMASGKPAGVPCVQLTSDYRCRLFGAPERPECCSGLQASFEMCGNSRTEALLWLTALETATAPDPSGA